MEKQNFEFEKMNNENSTNKKTKKPLLKRLGGALKIAVVTLLVTLVASSFVACDLFNGGKDNPDDLNQGITVPEDPDDPEKPDEPENPDDPENPIDPDDPENPIDPDDPENPIDPDDPEKPIDPEDPEQPVDPDDPENPDENEPQDITEVDEIDEINKFGDEAIKILNNNYLENVLKKVVGKNFTIENIVDGSLKWSIIGTNNNITGLKVEFKYDNNNDRFFYVGNVDLQSCSINDLVNENTTVISYSKDLGITTSITNIEANKELGNLVINTVNGTNTETQNEGDIWCSIGSLWAESGKEYRTIKVYQINENQVQKYELIVEAPTVNVEEIMQNIKDEKIKGQGSCTNEYTFKGQKIEQKTSSSSLNTQYNSYAIFNDFDDEYVFE